MLLKTQQHAYPPEEYRHQEETAEFRSAYHDGSSVPMTGGAINHNRITVNLCTALKVALRGSNAPPFMSDLRVWIPR